MSAVSGSWLCGGTQRIRTGRSSSWNRAFALNQSGGDCSRSCSSYGFRFGCGAYRVRLRYAAYCGTAVGSVYAMGTNFRLPLLQYTPGRGRKRSGGDCRSVPGQAFPVEAVSGWVNVFCVFRPAVRAVTVRVPFPFRGPEARACVRAGYGAIVRRWQAGRCVPGRAGRAAGG